MTIATKIAASAVLLTAFVAAVTPARGADNLGIERLAICQDSWLDWKSGDPARLQRFVDGFQAEFSRNAHDPFFVPRSSQSVAGLPVAQVFPQSVGMGVGFSVVVDATFDRTKKSLEAMIGRSITKCEPPSDNMRTCELEIGVKKTLVLMAEDNVKATKTLLGCYYFYEK